MNRAPLLVRSRRLIHEIAAQVYFSFLASTGADWQSMARPPCTLISLLPRTNGIARAAESRLLLLRCAFRRLRRWHLLATTDLSLGYQRCVVPCLWAARPAHPVV